MRVTGGKASFFLCGRLVAEAEPSSKEKDGFVWIDPMEAKTDIGQFFGSSFGIFFFLGGDTDFDIKTKRYFLKEPQGCHTTTFLLVPRKGAFVELVGEWGGGPASPVLQGAKYRDGVALMTVRLGRFLLLEVYLSTPAISLSFIDPTPPSGLRFEEQKPPS